MTTILARQGGEASTITTDGWSVSEAVNAAWRALVGIGYHPEAVSEAMETEGREWLAAFTPSTE